MHTRAFKSIAERDRLERLVKAGGFKQADFDAMHEASKGSDLPDRLTPKSQRPSPAPKLSAGRSTRYDRLALAPRDEKTHY